MIHCVAHAKALTPITGCYVSVSLSFRKVYNGSQLLMISFPRINNLLKDIDESYVTVQVYRDQYEDIFSKL